MKLTRCSGASTSASARTGPAAARLCAASLRSGGEWVDATREWLVGVKGEYPIHRPYRPTLRNRSKRSDWCSISDAASIKVSVCGVSSADFRAERKTANAQTSVDAAAGHRSETTVRPCDDL